MTTVRAAVVSSREDNWHFVQAELEDPQQDELLVRLVACGICETDVAARKGNLPQNVALPAVFGHEGSGIVEKIGPAVTEFQPGDHVVLTVLNCGKCLNCLQGHPAYCEHFMQLNFSGRRQDGSATLQENGQPLNGSFFGQSSFATYALASERNAVKVSKDLDLVSVAPLGCGIQTGAGTVINVLRPTEGSSLAVFGVGAVGMSALMAAMAAGCKTIVAVDVHDNRLALARELGATHTVNSNSEQILARIKEELGGVDFVVDTTGNGDVIRQAIACLVSTGHCAMVGVPKPGAEIPFPLIHRFMGQRLSGVIEGDCVPKQIIPRLIALWQSGRFPFDKLIKFYDFSEINEAVADSGKGVAIKPVLRIDPTYVKAA